MTKSINWKTLYEAAPDAVHGREYAGHILHVVPTRRKHDSGYRAFQTYLVTWHEKGEERVPSVVRLYSGNDVVCFEGKARWSGPPVPLRMDMRMDGVTQFWAEDKKLVVQVIGFSNCDVRVS